MPKSPPYFWWALANLLALCFALLSWTICLEVFAHPEVPRNYELLERLGRLPKVKDFSKATLPKGSLHGPVELYRKFFGIKTAEFEELNTCFRRDFIRNYEDPVAMTYVEGDYQVLQVRRFAEDDFLIDGFAVRARAMVKPDDFSPPAPYPVVIEFLFPTADEAAAERFVPGDVISFQKGPHCATVIHAGKQLEGDEEIVRLTLMPIAYGSCHLGRGAEFVLTPPERVRPTGTLPVF